MEEEILEAEEDEEDVDKGTGRNGGQHVVVGDFLIKDLSQNTRDLRPEWLSSYY